VAPEANISFLHDEEVLEAEPSDRPTFESDKLKQPLQRDTSRANAVRQHLYVSITTDELLLSLSGHMRKLT
jgi:hypothetical protein